MQTTEGAPTRSWPGRVALLATVAALAGVGVAIAQTGGDEGRIGPELKLTANGHQLDPLGRQVALGNFPTGGTVSRDGRFYWTVSAGRGPNDVRIVEIATGRVVQVLPIPGASGGIVADPRADRVYVAGVADSPDTLQKSPPGTPGVKGDVIDVFRYDAAGRATLDHVIAVPPAPGASAPQNFPPTNTQKLGWPDRLAISPDGQTLLVPQNLADAAAIVKTASGAVRYVKTGNYPYGAAILRDGKTGLVSNETPGTVSVIDLQVLATNPASTAAARLSARLPSGTDQIPRRLMDQLLWESVHGAGAAPPPPGPNAVPNG